MEVVIALSLVLAGVVGGVGLIAVYRRRQAESRRLRSDDMRKLDQRISSRIATLRGAEATPRPDSEQESGPFPMPALVAAAGERSWLQRLGLGRRDDVEGGGSRATLVRDGAIVLALGLVLLVVASQFLPAASPPNSTASPSATNLAVVPSATVSPSPSPGTTPSPTAFATPTPDVTEEPTAEPGDRKSVV